LQIMPMDMYIVSLFSILTYETFNTSMINFVCPTQQ
jgi:hypothetical protein